MKKIILLLIFILLNLNVFPGNYVYPNGSNALGTGNAFISKKDISSAFHNQAGLYAVKKSSLSFNYENRFLLNDFHSFCILFVLPTNTGNFALSLSNIGIYPISKSKISCAFSKPLSQRLSAGIQINYFTSNFSESNFYSAEAGIEFGLIYDLNKKSSVGIHLSNPYNISFSKIHSANNNYTFRIGGHSKYNDMFTVSAEVENFNIKEFNFKAGIESEILNNLKLRGGINTNVFSFYGGIGYSINNCTFDFAFAYYKKTGIYPSITISYVLK